MPVARAAAINAGRRRRQAARHKPEPIAVEKNRRTIYGSFGLFLAVAYLCVQAYVIYLFNQYFLSDDNEEVMNNIDITENQKFYILFYRASTPFKWHQIVTFLVNFFAFVMTLFNHCFLDFYKISLPFSHMALYLQIAYSCLISLSTDMG